MFASFGRRCLPDLLFSGRRSRVEPDRRASFNKANSTADSDDNAEPSLLAEHAHDDRARGAEAPEGPHGWSGGAGAVAGEAGAGVLLVVAPLGAAGFGPSVLEAAVR